MKKKVNYLRNRDLMTNIHLSKATYTWYVDGDWKNTKFLDYDLIACDREMYEETRSQMMLQKINNKRIKSGNRRTSLLKEEHIDMLDREDYELIDSRIVLFDGEFTEELIKIAKLGHHNRKLYENGNKRISELPQEIEDSIAVEDLVVRVYSFDHIPEKEDVVEAKVKKVADRKVKVNFPPYKHYAFVNGKTECVAISHHNKKGEFSIDHGNANNNLAISYIKLCDRIAKQSNWRGYSYAEDMQGHALVQLTNVGLQFNEMFSNNPFAYYTSVINNAFTVVFNDEKDVQGFRDKVLMEHDYTPSWTQQMENEQARLEHWDRVSGQDTMKPSDVTYIDVDEYNEEQG